MFILVVDHRGREHTLPAIDGWRVREVIRDWGIDLTAGCAGAGCHVDVDEPWIERLRPPTSEEEDRLDKAFGVAPTSRLSCQILISSSLADFAFAWRQARSDPWTGSTTSKPTASSSSVRHSPA